MIKDSLPYVLCRIEDDSSVTPISQHQDLLTGVAAGKYAVEVEDFDYAYALHTADDVRVSTFGKGRIGYREWARRNGRLTLPRSEDEYIHSLDDRYDHDTDQWVS